MKKALRILGLLFASGTLIAEKAYSLSNLDSLTDVLPNLVFSVPEPEILILLGIAMSAVGLTARRFKI
jgi:hypothetical protein